MSTTTHTYRDFHHPVSVIAPLPTASTTGDHVPRYEEPRSSPPTALPTIASTCSRRPMTPRSLRLKGKLFSFKFLKITLIFFFSDLDLSDSTPDMPLVRTGKYPAPLTGHDLMAIFPTATPDNFKMHPGRSTSVFFERQERAFFAQPGKEIVRVRVEVDFPHGSELDVKQPWSLNGPGPSSSTAPPHHSLEQSPFNSYPHPATRQAPRDSDPQARVSVPVNPFPVFPLPLSSDTSRSNQLPSNVHPPASVHRTISGLRTPPEDSTSTRPNSKPENTASEEYEHDESESWRRPTPNGERRRAGKHTRHVRK
jgi:hypothetical protein